MDHQNHFHVYLRPPPHIPIGTGGSLMAEPSTYLTHGGDNMTLPDFSFEIPEITPAPQSYLLVQAPSSKQTSKIDTTVWSGQAVEQDGGINQVFGEEAQLRILRPGEGAFSSLTSSGWLRRNGVTAVAPRVTATLERAPKNGVIEVMSDGRFRYTPNKNFLGKDFVTFIVTIEGKRIRSMWPLFVVENIEEPKAHIRDAQQEIEVAAVVNTLGQIAGGKFRFGPLSPNHEGVRYTGLGSTSADSPYTFNNISVTFAALEGQAVGNAMGVGPAAQITLDKDAAGHGWFIDTTPSTNIKSNGPGSN